MSTSVSKDGKPSEVKSIPELWYVVYSGSEKVDLGDKRPACFCQSRVQAEHMIELWPGTGYWEKLDEPIVGIA